MRRKVLSLAFVFIMILPLFTFFPSAYAHAPEEMHLEYDHEQQILDVEIVHTTNQPYTHHVYEIVIWKNGEIFGTYIYAQHFTSYTFVVPAEIGDVLRVRATCNQGGSITRELTVVWYPDPPSYIIADAGDSHVALYWIPPESTGGLPIKGYNISNWSPDTNESTHITTVYAPQYVDFEVQNGVEMKYRITAFTDFGESSLSNVTSAMPEAGKHILVGSNHQISYYASGGDGSSSSPWIIEGKNIDAQDRGYGIFIQHTTQHLVLRGITVFGADSVPALGGGTGIYLMHVENVLIEQCTFRDNRRFGIRILQSSNVRIENNHISENHDPTAMDASTGIHLSDVAYSTVSGNSLERNTGYGLRVHNSRDMQIRDNTITGSRNGVYMQYTMHSILSGNTIDHAPGQQYAGDPPLQTSHSISSGEQNEVLESADPPGFQAEADYRSDGVIVKFSPEANLGLYDGKKSQITPFAITTYPPTPGSMVVEDIDVNMLVHSIELRVGGQMMRSYPSMGLGIFDLDGSTSVEEAVILLSSEPHIEYAEPDYIVQPLEETPLKTPNDPHYSLLWGLQTMDAPTAWGVTTGNKDVVVGVLDTGVDYTHPDLSANIWFGPDGPGYNAINMDHDTMDISGNGHGTHVAGTLGAVGNNSQGITGVNWDVKIMPLRFIGPTGGLVSHAIGCLDYAAQQKNNGVNIVATSNSWGGISFSKSLYDAIAHQRDLGILFVAGSGNDRSDNDASPFYPASYNLTNVISVAGSDRYNRLATRFSNYGQGNVHVAAPGTEIYSTLPNNGYGYMQGTSMSTPHVAGLAALISSAYPEYDYIQLKNLIMSTSMPRGDFTNLTITEGVVNAGSALGEYTPALNVYIYGVSSTTHHLIGSPEAITVIVSDGVNPLEASVTIEFDNGEPPLHPSDSGGSVDQVEGDGYYTALWIPRRSGMATMTVSVSTTLGNRVVRRNLSIYGITGIYLNNCDHIAIYDTGVSYNLDGIVIREGDHNSIVSTNSSDNRNTGLHVAGGEHLLVSTSYFHGNAAPSVLIERVAYGIVENSDITPSAFGYKGVAGLWLIDSYSMTVRGMHVSGFHNCIRTDMTTNSLFTENTIIDGNYGGISLLTESNDNVVVGNTMHTGSYGVTLQYSKRIIVRDNDIFSSRGGIWLTGMEDVFVHNNSMVDINGMGMSVTSSNNSVISNNTITACATAGIAFTQSEDIHVENNTISDSHFGIDLRVSSTMENRRMLLRNNTFHGNNAAIFAPGPTDVLVEGGTIDVPPSKIGVRTYLDSSVTIVDVNPVGEASSIFLYSYGNSLVTLSNVSRSSFQGTFYRVEEGSLVRLQDNGKSGFDSFIDILADNAVIETWWTLDIAVSDQKHNPAEGSNVRIYDASGKLVFSREEAPANFSTLCLAEETRMESSGLANITHTPHRITAGYKYSENHTIVHLENRTFARVIVPNVPPHYLGIPDIQLVGGSSTGMHLDNFFIDPEEEPITYSVASKNTLFQAYIEGGKYLHIVASKDVWGQEEVVIKATDLRGEYTYGSFMVDVIRYNYHPVVAKPFPEFAMRQDTSANFVLNLNDFFRDPDRYPQPLSFYHSGDGKIRVTITQGWVSFDPDIGWTGSSLITFYAHDGNKTVSSDWLVSVLEPEDETSRPPVLLSPLPDVVLNEGTTATGAFDLDIHFHAFQGYLQYFVAGNVNVLVSIDNQNRANFEAPWGWSGVENMTFRAFDGNNWAEDSISVTVRYVPRAPVWGVLPEAVMDENTVLYSWINLLDYVSDEDTLEQDLVFSIYEQGSRVLLVLQGSILSLYPDEDWHGVDRAELMVSDGDYARVTVLSITVMHVNQPPVAIISSPADDSRHLSRRPISFDGSMSHDREGPVSHVWDLGDGTVKTGSRVSHTYSQEGSYLVSLQVVDGMGLTSFRNMSIVVYNSPPAITLRSPDVASLSLRPGQKQVFMIEVEDENDHPTVRWLLDGLQVESGTNSYIHTAGSPGEYVIRVETTDGVDTASFQWTLSVLELEEPQPPVPDNGISTREPSEAQGIVVHPGLYLLVVVVVLAALLARGGRGKRKP